MTAMLHCLIGDVADDLRAALPAGWAAANDETNAALIGDLLAAELLDEPDLMLLLLRRADEERIAGGAKARSGRRDARALQGLVSHDDRAVSAAAMALILARGRRRDRFGQCLITIDDLLAAKPDSQYAPFLLKIDIEGAERDLFSGNEIAFNRFPLIVFEPHDWMFPGQLSSLDFFRFHASAGREFAMNNENIASIAVERLHQ